jgi:hypothetical protein
MRLYPDLNWHEASISSTQFKSQSSVITVTAPHSSRRYAQYGYEGPVMAISGYRLNRFERFLFAAAVVLAGVLIVVRIGAMLLLSVLHHAR